MTEITIHRNEFSNNTDCGGLVVLKQISSGKLMLIDSAGCWSSITDVVVIDLKNKKATKYRWRNGAVWKEHYDEEDLKSADEVEEIPLI